ncbi:MAG: hypothetical protein KI785_07940 [Devosiaceae bacterium]|nr:hypothetical protein [Devosiaceae bacterium MH13]
MVPVIALFFATLIAFAGRPAADTAFAVIMPPGTAAADTLTALAAADGTLVRQSRYPWLIIAAPRTQTSAAAFRGALTRAGALLTLHPALLAGCFSDAPAHTTARPRS